MASEKPAHVVVHDRAQKRFVVRADGKLSYLEYAEETLPDGRTLLDFYHTFTDPALRGQGLASRVTGAAFEHARREEASVRPSCSYVHAYVARHAEYAGLCVAVDREE